MEEMDILSYGISMTTLEEVFLKVNGDLEEDTKPTQKERSSTVQGGSDDEDGLIREEAKGSMEDPSATTNVALSSENLVGKGTLW